MTEVWAIAVLLIFATVAMVAMALTAYYDYQTAKFYANQPVKSGPSEADVIEALLIEAVKR